jgi:5-formyltetrahydrofolate cyclo-ligase
MKWGLIYYVHPAQEITARLFSLTSFKHATSVSCYLSMPSGEVRTPTIVDAILTSGMFTHRYIEHLSISSAGTGKTLFVPKIQTTEGTMDFFRIHSADDLASLPSGTWGIKEPDELWQGEKRTSSALHPTPLCSCGSF